MATYQSRIPRKKKSQAEREAIEVERRATFERDGYRCVDCGKLITWDGPWWNQGQAAHIVSAARGGKFERSNLLTKCHYCHIQVEHQWGPSGRKPCPKKVSNIGRVEDGTTESS